MLGISIFISTLRGITLGRLGLFRVIFVSDTGQQWDNGLYWDNGRSSTWVEP